MTDRTTTCRECGALLQPQTKGRRRKYCSRKCLVAFQNRQALRGAELYAFVMAWRFERDKPDMLAQLTRLASAYRDADNHRRGGRPSWDAEEVQMRLPLAYGKEGDGR